MTGLTRLQGILSLPLVLLLAACPGDRKTVITGATSVDGMIVTPATATLSVGDHLQLSGTYVTNGFPTLNASLTWSSSNPGVATVDANGLVTAVARGTATITVFEKNHPLQPATAVVTVNGPVTNIVLTGTMTRTGDTCAVKGFVFVAAYNTTITITQGGTVLTDADPNLTRVATGGISGTAGAWDGSGPIGGVTFQWHYGVPDFGVAQPVATETLTSASLGCTATFQAPLTKQ